MSARLRSLDELGRECHALIFEVPGEPRGKGRPRAVAFRPKGRPFMRARLYADEKTVTYEARVAGAFAVAFPDWTAAEGEVELGVDAYFQAARSTPKGRLREMLAGLRRPTRKPDGPNILCAIADALSGIAYRDDAQITDQKLIKRFSERPRAEILVRIHLDRPQPAAAQSENEGR
jgi:Holliday junction resolvase RusA-like endonuclease